MENLPVIQVSTHEQAIAALSTKRPKLLSLITPAQLRRLLGQVRAGAFDFDGTLVTGSQWMQLDQLLPPELQKEADRIRSWYFAQTQDGHATPILLDHPDWFHGRLASGNRLVAEGAWIAEGIRLFEKARITKHQLQETATHLPARDGAIALLQLMQPRVIISFGIEQIIQAWLAHHAIEAPIAASRLFFNDFDIISGCHINLVASETKKLAADRFRLLTDVHEQELLVIGDSLVDVEMMHSGGLNVLIIPPGEQDKRLVDFRHNHLSTMWDRLSLILQSDSLQPLVNLIMRARH